MSAFFSFAFFTTFSTVCLARSWSPAARNSPSFASHSLTFPSALEVAARCAPNELEGLRSPASSPCSSSSSSGDNPYPCAFPFPLSSTTTCTSSSTTFSGSFNAAGIFGRREGEGLAREEEDAGLGVGARARARVGVARAAAPEAVASGVAMRRGAAPF